MDIVHIEKLVAQSYRERVDAVITGLKGLGREHMQSGDDSPHQNVWEEFAAQLQEGERSYFDAYESTVRQFCHHEVKKMSETERKLLWFFTEPGQDWTFDIDYDKEHEIERDPTDDQPASFDEDDVVDELYKRISQIAWDMELPPTEEENEDEAEEDEALPKASARTDSAELSLPLFE